MIIPVVNPASFINTAHPLMRGVIARWRNLPMVPLQTGTANAFRDLLRQNDIAFSGGAWTPAGQPLRPGGWRSVGFNSPGYGVIPKALLSNRSEGSVNVWAYPTRAYNSSVRESLWGQIQSADTNPELCWMHFGDDNHLYIGWNGPSGDDRLNVAASATNWTQNAWMMCTITWLSGGNTDVYVNGSSIGTKASTHVYSITTDGRWGHHNLGSMVVFGGNQDDLTIWNRKLTAGEVLNLFNATRQQFDPTLSWIELQGYDPVIADILMGQACY